MKKFVINKIETSHAKKDQDLIKRLYDLGFRPGLEVEVVSKVSFNSITILQYGNTRIALNQEEFACLHGH